MTESKRELIVENLIGALATISVTGGDNNDVTSLDVQERLFTYDELGEIRLPCITVTSGDEVAVVSMMGGTPKYRGTWSVYVQGFVKSEDKTTIRKMLERLLRDVRKKIFTDMTRGGYAHTQRVVRVKTDEGTLAYEGYGVFEIELEIVYDYMSDAP